MYGICPTPSTKTSCRAQRAAKLLPVVLSIYGDAADALKAVATQAQLADPALNLALADLKALAEAQSAAITAGLQLATQAQAAGMVESMDRHAALASRLGEEARSLRASARTFADAQAKLDEEAQSQAQAQA